MGTQLWERPVKELLGVRKTLIEAGWLSDQANVKPPLEKVEDDGDSMSFRNLRNQHHVNTSGDYLKLL